MINHLLVLLEKAAVPFCYYDNPYYYSPAASHWLPLAVLQDIVSCAAENQLTVTFIYGPNQLPPEYAALIETISHTKIIPCQLSPAYPDGLAVADASATNLLQQLPKQPHQNLIVRVPSAALTRLSTVFESLLGKFKRLNFHLEAIDYLTPAQLADYETQLQKISAMLAEAYRRGEEPEVNVLSDRLLLTAMNNCNAGQQHITIAPDGNCYICPGFYYHNEQDSLGSFDSLHTGSLKNSQLFELSYAPLCNRCDAFHCKRCIFLNYKTTGEVNIPSAEQCQVSHIERDVSRQLLKNLGELEPFAALPRLPYLHLRDPLYKLTDPVSANEAVHEPSVLTEQETLTEMLALQKKILGLLQNK